MATATRTIKVAIAGINGKMGRASAKALLAEPGFEVVGGFGRSGADYVGKQVQDLAGVSDSKKAAILVSNGFQECMAGCAPDVLLEFTEAETAFQNGKSALERGIRPVIGTSGIPPEHVKELSEIAAKKKLGALVIPNFAVGAVLMMEFAKQAGAFYSNVEIVEMHHTKKVDAPSGTAMYTTRKLAEHGNKFNQQEVKEKELLANARGGKHESGVRVHSLRLPGLISHQEVIFGSPGELLTIRHDSFNTDCFIKGIVIALKSVMELDGLVLGLENVLTQDHGT